MGLRAIGSAFITFRADMKLTKPRLFIVLLLVLAVLIHLYSLNSTVVENRFSTGIYPPLGRFLRQLLGWLPFSLGDILYGGVIFWMIIRIVKITVAIVKRKISLKSFIESAGRSLRILLVVYILFNLLWGINYNREGIARQLDLSLEKYSLADLQHLNTMLVEKVNASKTTLLRQQQKYPDSKQLFARVTKAYDSAERTYPFLHYKPASIKPSMWSWLGNYMGFTGYYNPFTGEAQVNTLVPEFLQPFTSCHEVAHQLGYAKEMEANFVGYLAATYSNDTLLHYSVYLDLFMYSNRNLFEIDSLSSKEFRKQLIPAVGNDLKEWKRFYERHRNPFEPVFRWIYGIYLRRNQQPQGVLSYDEVTGFMIAYFKKFGKI